MVMAVVLKEEKGEYSMQTYLFPLFEGITRLLNWERAIFNIAILIIFVEFHWISTRPWQHLHDILVNKQKEYRLDDVELVEQSYQSVLINGFMSRRREVSRNVILDYVLSRSFFPNPFFS